MSRVKHALRSHRQWTGNASMIRPDTLYFGTRIKCIPGHYVFTYKYTITTISMQLLTLDPLNDLVKHTSRNGNISAVKNSANIQCWFLTLLYQRSFKSR